MENPTTELQPIGHCSTRSTDTAPSSPKPEPVCPTHSDLYRRVASDGKPFCARCFAEEAARKEAEEFRAKIPQFVADRLIRAGMSRRELAAEVARIPAEIKRALPVEQVKAMLAGEVPSKGFGISTSETGAGKTFAMAAILKACMVANVTAQVDSGTSEPKANWLQWETWPAAVAWFRMNATSLEFPEVIQNLLTKPVLFLDDLGAERIKGSYVEDFAASQLDLIVDERYRNMLPILYTTNLDMGGLIERYGARLVSRLCGDNPLCSVQGLPDQRIGGAR